MPNYRRVLLPGHTWFFTLVSHCRQPLLTHPRVRTALREAIHAERAEHTFEIVAWVLLPDHLHCLWRLPEQDGDYASRWARIKRNVGSQCADLADPSLLTPAMRRRHFSGLWQTRYWEHAIRDQDDENRHRDYIHYNPVKHGLVARAADWPYSTFHREVRAGVYPPDWGLAAELSGDFGE